MAKKTVDFIFDDLNDHLMDARALADSLYNQDPECDIGQKTLFHVSRMLVKKIDAAQKMWEGHWDAQQRLRAKKIA